MTKEMTKEESTEAEIEPDMAESENPEPEPELVPKLPEVVSKDSKTEPEASEPDKEDEDEDVVPLTMPGGLILLNEDSHFLEEVGPLRDLVQTVSNFCGGLISKWWGYSPSNEPTGIGNVSLSTEQKVSEL